MSGLQYQGAYNLKSRDVSVNKHTTKNIFRNAPAVTFINLAAPACRGDLTEESIIINFGVAYCNQAKTLAAGDRSTQYARRVLLARDGVKVTFFEGD